MGQVDACNISIFCEKLCHPNVHTGPIALFGPAWATGFSPRFQEKIRIRTQKKRKIRISPRKTKELTPQKKKREKRKS